MSKVISVSVHDIVDAVLRTGNLDNRVFNTETMAEGSVVHRDIQSQQGANYHSEYPLRTLFIDGDLTLDIQGRADGLITGQEIETIDEIKSTIADLEAFKEANYEWHQGQAKMYAWMFARQNHRKAMNVRLTYVRQHRESERLIFNEQFTFEELNDFCCEVIKRWLEDYRRQSDHVHRRNESLKRTCFPFSSWRAGQRDMYEFCTQVVHQHKIGYCQAPTGIGKTVCALMPAIVSMADEGGPERVYYLTSKTSIRRQALKTAHMLEKGGTVFRAIVVGAKERVCLNVPELKKRCNPRDCPFAVDFFTKLRDVMIDGFSQKNILDVDDIVALAQKWRICPFELEMSMAQQADVVICDYNYIYDPEVRAAGNLGVVNNPFTILVDEAHNLPHRAREMYSAALYRADLERALRELKGREHHAVRQVLRQILGFFDRLGEEYPPEEGDARPIEEIPVELSGFLRTFANLSLEESKRAASPLPQSFLDLCNEVKSFRNMLPDPPKNYTYYLQYDHRKVISFHCQCLDAAKEIHETTTKFDSCLFFSATLSPFDYYITLLGGVDVAQENTIRLPSPFDPKHRLILADVGVDTRYRYRDSTLERVVASIHTMVESRVGNYLVFFPSFAYMAQAVDLFRQQSAADIIVQSASMSLEDRDEFIASFHAKPSYTTVGFAVLGGVFSEGIEMEDGALSGVAIVTVGLPTPDLVNKRLQTYYTDNGIQGFDFAFRFPGFNRVVQAAGRVIRREQDRGVILLIDHRLSSTAYGRLIRETFGHVHKVQSPAEVKELCQKFWERADGEQGR